MRPSHTTWGFLAAAALLAAAPLACMPEDTGRTASEGSGEQGTVDGAKASADATATGATGGTGTNTSVGTDGSGGGTLPNGKTLEQCTAEKKAWRAVVNNGGSPADCTEPLVSWCCTRAE